MASTITQHNHKQSEATQIKREIEERSILRLSSSPQKDIGSMPMEIMHHVFSFLAGRELGIAQQVCTTFHTIANDDKYWRVVAERQLLGNNTDPSLLAKPDNRTWKWLCKSKKNKLTRPVHSGTGVALIEGALYEGDWFNDLPHGQGTKTSKKSDNNNTEHDQEKEEEEEFVYTGAWQQGRMDGQGHYLALSNDYEYRGAFKDGKREGEGVLTHSGMGLIAKGQYHDNQIYNGTLESSSGSVYTGEIRDFEPHGTGKYTFVDGRTFEGQWRFGEISGASTCRLTDGRKFIAHYKHDTIDYDASLKFYLSVNNTDVEFEVNRADIPATLREKKHGVLVWCELNTLSTNTRDAIVAYTKGDIPNLESVYGSVTPEFLDYIMYPNNHSLVDILAVA